MRKPRNSLQESSDPSHRALTNSTIININETSVLKATYNEPSSSSTTSTHRFEPLTNCIKKMIHF